MKGEKTMRSTEILWQFFLIVSAVLISFGIYHQDKIAKAESFVWRVVKAFFKTVCYYAKQRRIIPSRAEADRRKLWEDNEREISGLFKED
jgi:hypothetical membrane protein